MPSTRSPRSIVSRVLTAPSDAGATVASTWPISRVEPLGLELQAIELDGDVAALWRARPSATRMRASGERSSCEMSLQQPLLRCDRSCSDRPSRRNRARAPPSSSRRSLTEPAPTRTSRSPPASERVASPMRRDRRARWRASHQLATPVTQQRDEQHAECACRAARTAPNSSGGGARAARYSTPLALTSCRHRPRRQTVRRRRRPAGRWLRVRRPASALARPGARRPAACGGSAGRAVPRRRGRRR